MPPKARPTSARTRCGRRSRSELVSRIFGEPRELALEQAREPRPVELDAHLGERARDVIADGGPHTALVIVVDGSRERGLGATTVRCAPERRVALHRVERE